MSKKDVSKKDMSEKDVSEKDMSEKDMSEKNMSEKDMSEMNISEKEKSAKETKRILIYLGITFALTYIYSFAIVYPVNHTTNIRTEIAVVLQLLIGAIMFFPAIGVFLTRLITREGFKNSMLIPKLKGNIKWYLAGYFGPGILVLLGAAFYFLIFPDKFDANCGYLVATLEAQGATVEMLGMPAWMLLVIQVGEALLLGGLLNFITCFGEEWGWRGYLLPKMAAKMPAIPMLLVTGVIWGLWHAPLTAIGHNYGVGYPGFPILGIAAMCFFCIVMGIFLSFLTFKTKCCIPAIFAHGAVNSIASVGMFFTKDGGNPFIGPAPTGFVGAMPFILVAVAIVIFYFIPKKHQREA